MIRIVNGPQDLKGFDQDQLYRVYDLGIRNSGAAVVPELVALASTIGEALDAREMLGDLCKFNRDYHIAPPKAQTN
jgi:hypothetical protein